MKVLTGKKGKQLITVNVAKLDESTQNNNW